MPEKATWTPSDSLHRIIVYGLLLVALLQGATSALYLFTFRTMPPGEGMVLPIITGLLGFMGQKRMQDPGATGNTLVTGSDATVSIQPETPAASAGAAMADPQKEVKP